MKALTWQGKRSVSVEEVPDPRILEPTDAIAERHGVTTHDGVTDLVTPRAPLADAPQLYELFQKKEDGCIKVVLTP